MEHIISIIAVPISGIITYILGWLGKSRKISADAKKQELDNTQAVVDFYKGTFTDLQKEIHSLRSEMSQLREENISLKRQLKELNDKLFFLTQNKQT